MLMTLFLILVSADLFAQSVGRVSYGGTGCPQGSISQSYLTRTGQLVLNYRQFSLRSGNGTGKTLDRQACALSVPVSVPEGYQMARAYASKRA